MTVLIRPRSQWEAIDLGMLVARRWFMKLWCLWLAATLPFLVVIVVTGLLIPGPAASWTALFFWLGKPLYEPPLLLWVSRILFDEQLTIRQATKEMRRQFTLRRLIGVGLLRLNPLRSFTLPVLLLEGLTGKARRQRSAILNHGYETSLFLSFSCWVIEIIVTFGLLTALYWLIPEDLRWVNFGGFLSIAETWMIVAFYLFSCSLIAPFYVCSGFMLYLSRRVELEAWDLEIGFKQINSELRQRKSGTRSALTGLVLCLGLLQFAAGGSQVQAAVPTVSPEEAHKTIETVLTGKEFGQKQTVTRWVYKEHETTKENQDWLKVLEPLIKMIASFFEQAATFLGATSRYLVWIFAGCVVALLLIRYNTIRRWLNKYLPQISTPSPPPPAKMFGMDIRPESLPDNIDEECRRLVESGEKRQALSLLYRSVLSLLVNSHQLRISSSLTEMECSAVVKKYRNEPEATYFHHLTEVWLITAYGHLEPAAPQCLSLIEQHRQLYGGER